MAIFPKVGRWGALRTPIRNNVFYQPGSLAGDVDPDIPSLPIGFEGSDKPFEENLLADSESLSGFAYQCTVTADTTAAPTGPTTADTVTENGVNDEHSVSQDVSAITVPKDKWYTYSAYVKRGSGTRNVSLTLQNSNGDYNYVEFNLGTGVVTLKQFNGVTNAANVAAGIEPAGNSFYRVWCASKFTSAFALDAAKVYMISAGSVVYTGNSTSSLIVWGQQINRGAGLASYINTTSYGQVIAAGLASEPDSAFTVLRAKKKSAGLASTADSSFGLVIKKSRPVGLASSADTGFAIARRKNRLVGLAQETGSAFVVFRPRVLAVGMASEAATGFAVSRSKRRAAGLASEVASGFALGRIKVRATGLAVETDTAFAVTSNQPQVVAVGLASENSTGFAVTRRKARTTGLASETGAGFAVVRLKRRAAGLTAEADSAFAVTRGKVKDTGLASTADTGFAVTRLKRRAAGLAAGTDSGLAVSRVKTKTAGLSVETGSAMAVNRLKRRDLGLAVEADSAFTVTGATPSIYVVGLATSTETALAVQALRRFGVGLAVSVDAGLGITWARAVTLGMGAETSLAFAIVPVGGATGLARTGRRFGATYQQDLVREAQLARAVRDNEQGAAGRDGISAVWRGNVQGAGVRR